MFSWLTWGHHRLEVFERENNFCLELVLDPRSWYLIIQEVAFRSVNIKFMSSSFEKFIHDYFSFDIETDVQLEWKWRKWEWKWIRVYTTVFMHPIDAYIPIWGCMSISTWKGEGCLSSCRGDFLISKNFWASPVYNTRNTRKRGRWRSGTKIYFIG